MDAQSNYHFHEMASCVVDEYSGFCPLPSNFTGARCIDGAQTQGENIADNGGDLLFIWKWRNYLALCYKLLYYPIGMHAAFRAYKNYINLNGPDPLLPDPMMAQFTADQLFFMSFAQVCWAFLKYYFLSLTVKYSFTGVVPTASIPGRWGTPNSCWPTLTVALPRFWNSPEFPGF